MADKGIKPRVVGDGLRVGAVAVGTVIAAKGASVVRKTLLTCAVALATVAAVGEAGAAGYRNFASLTGGVNAVWNPLVAILAIFGEEPAVGYGGSLGFGTRLGRDSHFVFYACYAHDQLRFDEDKSKIDSASLNQVRANLRYYVGGVSRGPAVYAGLGPDLMFAGDDVGVNVNLSVGGDFPVGRGWSVLVDGTLDVAVAYGHLGLAYWFE